MNSKTRAISEGAMMLAIICIFLLLNRNLAGLIELMIFFLSIPIIIYTLKYQIQMGITLACATMILGVIISTPTSIFYLFSAMVIGLIYGYGVGKKWENYTLLFLCIIANLITTFISVIVLANIFGFNINEDVKMFMDYIPNIDMNIDIKQFVLTIVLIAYLGSAIIQAFVTHLWANQLLRRFHLENKQMKSMFEYKIPKFMTYIIILSFIMYLFSTMIKLDDNLNIIILAFYASMLILSVINGYISVVCFLKIRGKARITNLCLLLLACFMPILQNIIGVIGVFDIYEGFRNSMKEGMLNEIHRKN